ncbi:MAG TPA: LysR family transcriptional regulator [Acidimicrobiales bacterium]|nr:LysR family transcriptional regulator [Acidimicrobiales bacterium]
MDYRSSPLDARRLGLFLAVVDHGGFTRAARAVYISQPALSQAIAELETELGCQLFHRLGRDVKLTSAGEALVGPARGVLRQLDAARQVTAEVIGLSGGRLDVSALRSLSVDPLPALLGPFVLAHPGIQVRIASPDDPAALIEHLRTGEAEIGLTDAAHVPSGLTAVPLGTQRLVVLFPPGAPPAPGALTPEQLADIPLIVTPAQTSGRALLDDLMQSRGLKATVRIETSQREALLPLVMAGAGAAVVPEALAAVAKGAGAVAVPVQPDLARALAVVHRGGPLTPPAEAFVAIAVAHGGG